MAKRVSWKSGEYILVLGLYLKLPYLNGAIPTPKDVVRLISEKFGITRTEDSIKMRLNNFMACDPVKIAEGIKGLDSGRQYCQPYWDMWSKDPQGLMAEIGKIVSADNATVIEMPSLELISLLPEAPSWTKLELTVLIHLVNTRVPISQENPMVRFYSVWFDKSIEDTVSLMEYFYQLLRGTFIVSTDPQII